MSNKRIVLMIAEIVFLLAFVCAGGIELDVFVTLLFGWSAFLARVVPRAVVNWQALAVAGTCLILITAGLHWFCSWLYREIVRKRQPQQASFPGWRLRWSLSIVGVVVLMFVAGVSAIGATHTVVWLRTK